jgi:hypothetical protein
MARTKGDWKKDDQQQKLVDDVDNKPLAPLERNSTEYISYSHWNLEDKKRLFRRTIQMKREAEIKLHHAIAVVCTRYDEGSKLLDESIKAISEASEEHQQLSLKLDGARIQLESAQELLVNWVKINSNQQIPVAVEVPSPPQPPQPPQPQQIPQPDPPQPDPPRPQPDPPQPQSQLPLQPDPPQPQPQPQFPRSKSQLSPDELIVITDLVSLKRQSTTSESEHTPKRVSGETMIDDENTRMSIEEDTKKKKKKKPIDPEANTMSIAEVERQSSLSIKTTGDEKQGRLRICEYSDDEEETDGTEETDEDERAMREKIRADEEKERKIDAIDHDANDGDWVNESYGLPLHHQINRLIRTFLVENEQKVFECYKKVPRTYEHLSESFTNDMYKKYGLVPGIRYDNRVKTFHRYSVYLYNVSISVFQKFVNFRTADMFIREIRKMFKVYLTEKGYEHPPALRMDDPAPKYAV